jgi:UDP-N-acetylglucosamine 1-carboxyvinyltransferase
MDFYKITGAKPLKGIIDVKGAKNSATKCMVASLLSGEKSVLENFPRSGETAITKELCERIGSKVSFNGSTCEIATPEIEHWDVIELSRRNRIPILALSPLLHRKGIAEVPVVGGDAIGPRPVNFHISALSKMGAKIEVREKSYLARAKKLEGAVIELPYPSVGATENIILAGVLAKGTTIIKNAAFEPEIIDVIKMLQKMGAIIELGTNRVITIEGVASLNGAKHAIMPDRNEAVSFAALAIATDGKILVRGALQEHLITFLNAVRRIGASYEVRDGGIIFYGGRNLKGIAVETDTHPGFMTDWQQPMSVLLTKASGESIIHETVYEDRFGYARDLAKMGARIEILSDCLGDLPCRFKGKGYFHSAVIRGPSRLKGGEINITDIRAGIAHLIAALSAEGESKITGIEHLDRGYEDLEKRLQTIGADIVRVKN